MRSAEILYGVGIVISVASIILWIPIIRAQIQQFNGNNTTYRIKVSLLVFAIASLCSNFVPLWFDIYRLIHLTNPSNIYYAYITSQYLYRISSAIMFFWIYKY